MSEAFFPPSRGAARFVDGDVHGGEVASCVDDSDVDGNGVLARVDHDHMHCELSHGASRLVHGDMHCDQMLQGPKGRDLPFDPQRVNIVSSFAFFQARDSGLPKADCNQGRLSLIDQTLSLRNIHASKIPLSLPCFISIAPLCKVELREISGLKHLDISVLSGCINLRKFVCSSCNHLRQVTWCDNGHCCSLSSLEFEDNPWLSKLPLQSFIGISTLSKLKCKGCRRLVSPPVEVANQGGKQTAAFLRNVAANGTFSSDMTLFLLGDGEAGKTSIFRALKSPRNAAEPIREDHRTVGIDMEEWAPSPDLDLRFRVMDLAGQAVYESTNQYFLQRRAVYLLVWRAYPVQDGRLNVLTDRIRHWLEALQMRVPGAQLMLVVTHIDAVETAALDEQCRLVKQAVKLSLASIRRWSRDASALRVEVFQGGESQRVNCLLGEGVARLRASLVNFALGMPWYREALPRSWVLLRAEVEQRIKDGHKFIDFQEWTDLARTQGLQGELFNICTSFLHETGIVRYFGTLFDAQSSSRKGAFYNTVFFDVQWMISVLKGLVRHDRQALQDYLASTGVDSLMLRRVNRLNATARLHPDLLPFLWPSVAASAKYWAAVQTGNQQERDLWSAGDVVSNGADVEKAVELLEGFDLVVRQLDEYLVPSILPRGRLQVSAHAFCSSVCTWKRLMSFPKLPASFFERVVVRVAGRVSSVEFCSTVAVFLFEGNVCTASIDSASDTAGRQHLIISSSGKAMMEIVSQEVKHVQAYFPGLNIRIHADITGQEPWQLVLVAFDQLSCDLLKVQLRKAATRSYLTMKECLITDKIFFDDNDLQQIRILVVAISEGLQSSKVTKRVLDHIRSRVAVIPVLLHSFNPSRPLHPLFGNYNRALDLSESTKVTAVLEIESRQQVMETTWAMTDANPVFLQEVTRLVKAKQDKQDHQISDAIDNVLLPRAKGLLDKWRPSMNSLEAILGDQAGPNACQCGHQFDREECSNMMLAQTNTSLREQLTVSCPSCSRVHLVFELISIPEVRQCHICVKSKENPPGIFSVRECKFHHGGSLHGCNTSLVCKVCHKKGRLPHRHLFDVYPPDIFVLGTDNALKEAETVLSRLEVESDTVMWVGSNGKDNVLALQRCSVVVLILTDDLICSEGRRQELGTVLALGKLVIPLLHQSSWTGPREQSQYWRVLAPGGTFHKLERFHPVLFDPLSSEAADSTVQQLSALVNSRIHREVSFRVFSQLPMLGIRLSGLSTLVSKWGGKKLRSMTTDDVTERFVKPETERSKLPWCEQAASAGAALTAEWFVSHAWRYLFLDVVSSLSRHFEGSDPVIWLDILSVSQHETNVERPSEWWSSVFLNAVGQTSRMVMVLDSWSSPLTLQRAWCIFEVFACESTCSEFHVAMTETVSNKFINDMKREDSVASMHRVLHALQCDTADAKVQQDRDNIFENIRRTVGFDRLNSMVACAISRALTQELIRSVQQPGNDVLLMLTAARVAWLSRQSQSTLQLLRKCLDQSMSNSKLRLDVVLDLWEVLVHEEDAHAAIELVRSERSALEMWSTRRHGQAETAASCLLAWLANESRSDDADGLSAACIRKMMDYNGVTGAPAHSLCRRLVALGHYEDARAMALWELKACEKELGPCHPYTLDCLELLSSTQIMLKDPEAMTTLRTCLAGREHVLGFGHGDATRVRLLLVGILQESARQENNETVALPVSVGGANFEQQFVRAAWGEHYAGSEFGVQSIQQQFVDDFSGGLTELHLDCSCFIVDHETSFPGILQQIMQSSSRSSLKILELRHSVLSSSDIIQ